MVPIPKSSPSSSSPNDYRLLSLVSKVLERHVYNLVFDHTHSINFLSDSQFGFCPGYSTETALLSVTQSWHAILEDRKSVCTLFLDLKKAFDSVPHKLLLDKLVSLGVHLICSAGFEVI